MPVEFKDDFRMGMNDTEAPKHLAPNELLECYNADLSERGGFSTRNGTKVYKSDIGHKITFGIEWIVANERYDVVIRDNNGVYELGILGDTFTKALEVNMKKLGYFFYRNIFYFSDGVTYYEWGNYDYQHTQLEVDLKTEDIVMAEDGTFYIYSGEDKTVNLIEEDFTTGFWEDVTLVPKVVSNVIRQVKPFDHEENFLEPINKCTMFIYHPTSFRVFATGNPENPTAVYYSEFGDPGYFKGTNVLFPGTNNDGPVRAITILIDAVMVSYKNVWYHWRGVDPDTDTIWKPLPIPYGCEAPGSVCMTPYSITYFDGDNVRTISASILSQEVTTIQPTDVIIPITPGRMEKNLSLCVRKSEAIAVFHDNKYMLAYCDDEGLDYNNKVLEFRWDGKGAFNINTGWEIYHWMKKDTGDLLICSNNYILITGQGNIITGDGYADIDTETGERKPIDLRVRTGPMDLGYPYQNKHAKSVYMSFRQYEDYIDESTVNITLMGDYVRKLIKDINLSESLTWGRTWGKLWGFSDVLYKEAEMSMISADFSILVEHSQIDDKVTVYSFGIVFEPMEAKPVKVLFREEELLR